MITEPPYPLSKFFLRQRKDDIDSTHELDLSEFKDLPSFAKTILKPRGYMDILLSFYRLSD